MTSKWLARVIGTSVDDALEPYSAIGQDSSTDTIVHEGETPIGLPILAKGAKGRQVCDGNGAPAAAPLTQPEGDKPPRKESLRVVAVRELLAEVPGISVAAIATRLRQPEWAIKAIIARLKEAQ